MRYAVRRSRNCTRSARVVAGTLAFALATFVPGARVARAQAVSPIDFGAAPLDEARLGVAFAVLAELADAPAILARPSSQTFADAAIARISAVTTDYAVRIEASRTRNDLAAAGGTAFDRGAADGDLAALTRLVLRTLPAPQDRYFAAGILAQQTAYDARVLRSPSDDATLRKALGAANVADAALPGLAQARAHLAALPPGAWNEIAASASAIVARFLGPQNPLPFPETDGVWVVLLRSRAVPGMTLRHGTPHLWFDIVRFDGTHRSIGAYPAGGDFAHDSRTLACAAGRENDVASEGAVAIEPPVGTTTAQLAEALEAHCDARPAARLTYRASAASDSRYVVDALLAVGVDASAVLKASALAARAGLR
jgi:hypothetical protein